MSEIRELAELPAGGVTGFGPNVRVNPRGIPVAVNETGEEKLPEDTTVTVADPIALGATMTLAGETVIVKSPDPITFKVREVE